MFPHSPELHVSCMKHNKIHNRDTGTWGNRNKEICPNLSDYRPGALGEEHSVFSTVCLINLLRLPVCLCEMRQMGRWSPRMWEHSVCSANLLLNSFGNICHNNFTGKRGTEGELGKRVNILETDKCGQLIRFICNLSAKCPVTMTILTPYLSALYNRECLLRISWNFLSVSSCLQEYLSNL